MMKKSKIYIVEDEVSLAILLKYNLTQAGFEVETIARDDTAELRLKAKLEFKDLPIIMLTARSIT